MSRIVIPNTGAGFSNPTEDLVGFQSVRGGGLTNTTFKFDTGIVEKIDQQYQTGVFSDPITLDSLGVTNLDRRVTTNYNAKAEFYNNYYKFDCGYFNDLNENFIVFFIA